MSKKGRCLWAAILAVVVVEPAAADEAPQYGGTLTVGSEFGTVSSTVWDPADWHWKVNNDALYLDHLLVADLDKSVGRGGPFSFRSGFWVPDEALTGELAERWEVVDSPPAIVMHLRRGVMWPDKPGVMKARELVADDVVFSFERVRSSPKALADSFGHIDRVEARDDHTVVFHLREYNVDWPRRFGHGLYDGILPREVAGIGPLTAKNAVGTGPFRLKSHRDGGAYVYARNSKYWGSTVIGGQSFKLPFVDKLVYPALKDDASAQAALRTGKLDILRNVPWQAVDALKTSSPKLLWERRLAASAAMIALRMDTKPFDDIRVRRAVNIAVNKQEIVARYYGGNAELFNHPMHKDWTGYYRPLEDMPESVRKLFVYDPDKARRLLSEAGYAQGFSFDVQVNGTNAAHLDLLTLVAGYLGKVGVKLSIKPLEYAVYLSVLKNGKHTAGYMMTGTHLSPIATLAGHFASNIYLNASRHSDPKIDKQIRAAYYIRDDGERMRAVRDITERVLEQASYVLLPTPYEHQAWWPWVKNYYGERYAGALRPGPVYARIWLDQKLKKSLGF